MILLEYIVVKRTFDCNTTEHVSKTLLKDRFDKVCTSFIRETDTVINEFLTKFAILFRIFEVVNCQEYINYVQKRHLQSKEFRLVPGWSPDSQ